jgi:undecaprenyl diphosphate synthase
MEEAELLKKIKEKELPQHVAIIMDGNGRWAKKRNLPRIAGHKAGIDTVRRIVEATKEANIKYLTLYTFSKENWLRPKKEIKYLFSLLNSYIKREVENLKREKIRLQFIGDIAALPKLLQKNINWAAEETRGNSELILTLAINYSSRHEIISAINELLNQIHSGKVKLPYTLKEDDFNKYLSTWKLSIPEPDLVIRTSGELRVSNFLLWQIAYAEFWITPTLWPDFTKKEYFSAILDYQRRQRRFGGIRPLSRRPSELTPS